MPVRDEPVGGFLEQLAARVPAPGGGAAAAVHAAHAAALLAMVARYSSGEKYAEHAAAIGRITEEADRLREEALRLADDDVTAFSAVTRAYGMPKGEDGENAEAEKASRSAAIATALAGAARPPAEVIATARRAVELAEELLAEPGRANRNVITDVAAAAEAARAAATTAQVNVEVNLSGIRDESLRATLAAAAAGVKEIAARAEEITAAVRKEINA
ncbi:cyclodeaminase/cyclohydrolase family protein [Streptomyces sp. A7024]|uniref:Cyclodeaminase/cyclohydrolase family protein n=1 Tax=Streptomyces coryli TaxID=1128680 RepID=A0A6G4TUU6_9ACTN|nr:cyclodeaminase/cyclohydrolase family protein [Streptomyces coryli]NGN63542.1 cyclodeaminase/cyclohydrolase family protein [Streptomyces coryli]